MGPLVVNKVFNCASAVPLCANIRARASPSNACTLCPPRRLVTSCQNGAPPQEPSQNGETLYPLARSSSSSSSLLSSPTSCLTINRDVLCGESIEHTGTIMVKGNVNSGAVIHASGDIVVLGQLDGEAHAGRNGDVHTVIFAGQLKSKALSIAGCDAKESGYSGGLFCKVASLSNGEVRVTDVVSQDNFASDIGDAPARALNSGAKPWFSVDVRSMRNPSKVAALTGAYIFVIGVALLLFPESLFGLFFNLKSSVSEWIRVGAVLAVVFGVYYIGTAWGDAKGCNGADSFYMSTVVGRVFIFLIFSWLVATGAGGLPLFLVGTVNLLGALTMLKALRRENMPQSNT